MAACELLSELRAAPVVGRFYMVPVVREYRYANIVGDWPVIGPKHTDVEFINFPDEHYHVDARFLTAAQTKRVRGAFGRYRYHESIEAVVGAWPLATRGAPLPKGRPTLARRKCTLATYSNAYRHQKAIQQLCAHYGEPAQPIRLDDGRLLCPHRKVDLSQFPSDDDGTVICPLHGLRVQIGHAT